MTFNNYIDRKKLYHTFESIQFRYKHSHIDKNLNGYLSKSKQIRKIFILRQPDYFPSRFWIFSPFTFLPTSPIILFFIHIKLNIGNGYRYPRENRISSDPEIPARSAIRFFPHCKRFHFHLYSSSLSLISRFFFPGTIPRCKPKESATAGADSHVSDTRRWHSAITRFRGFEGDSSSTMGLFALARSDRVKFCMLNEVIAEICASFDRFEIYARAVPYFQIRDRNFPVTSVSDLNMVILRFSPMKNIQFSHCAIRLSVLNRHRRFLYFFLYFHSTFFNLICMCTCYRKFAEQKNLNSEKNQENFQESYNSIWNMIIYENVSEIRSYYIYCQNHSVCKQLQHGTI